MSRTDIHRPKSLVTEDYEYVCSLDLDEHPPLVPNLTPSGVIYFVIDQEQIEAWAKRREEVFKLFQDSPEHVHGDNHQCDHCGAHFRYCAILRYKPTGNCLIVGETCLENRFALATEDFQAMRKAAELDREKHKIVEARTAFAKENPDLAFLAFGEIPPELAWNNFIVDLSFKLRRYGNLSEAQVAAARRTIQRNAESTARHQATVDARAAEKAAEAPVVVGHRVPVVGRVLSVREPGEYEQFPQWKMLVEDDRKFKVWGSIPKALGVEVDANGIEHYLAYDSLVNRRVSFVANIEAARPKPDGSVDASFGFFSRPRQAKRLEQEDA